MKIIGRKDRIDLPEFKLFDIYAKIDTGAYGCALHCHHIELLEIEGKPVLSFKVLDPSHPEYEEQTFYSRVFNDKIVKNSGGITEHRYTVKTAMIVFGKERKVEFSLTDRKDMKHPVLIGRKFLYKRYLVDVRLKNVSYKQKIR
jgi:hypothetical protein